MLALALKGEIRESRPVYANPTRIVDPYHGLHHIASADYKKKAGCRSGGEREKIDSGGPTERYLRYAGSSYDYTRGRN